MNREIFGDKSGKLVRRLEDSDEEVEPAKKKLAISSTSKPTDILAEVYSDETNDLIFTTQLINFFQLI